MDEYKDRFIDVDEQGNEWRKVKKYEVKFISFTGEAVTEIVSALDVTMAISTVKGKRKDFNHVDSVTPLD
jgi:hypothetical protein